MAWTPTPPRQALARPPAHSRTRPSTTVVQILDVLTHLHGLQEDFDSAQSQIVRQDFTFGVLQLLYGDECIDCAVREELLRHGLLLRSLKVRVPLASEH